MDIVKQTNPNECGVCVICSFIKHFYHHFDKLNVLDHANLTSDGLSVFDLEVLGQKYGLFLETYQLDWQEFSNYKTNTYLITLINKPTGMHYVIIRKNKEAITIYDSAVGQYNVSYSAFKSSFTNIVIQVSKSNIKVKLNNLNHFNLFKHVDLGYLCMNLLLQVLIIALSTIGANYLNIIINHAILTESGSNTIVISIVFLFIYCSNGLSQYILRLYIAKAFKFNYQYLSQKLLMCLKRKHHNFFDKVDRNYFYLIDNAMQTIVMYAINEVPMLCSNILLSIVTLIVIASISPWFLIVISLSIMISIIFSVGQYNYRQKLFNIAINNQNVNSDITRNFIGYLSQHHTNFLAMQTLVNQLQINYQQYLDIYVKKTKFDSGYEFATNAFSNLIFMGVVLIASYLTISHHRINIGQLTFIISLLGMVHNGINGVCDFVIKQIEFKKMSEIYTSFIEVGNVNNTGSIKIDNIKSISYVEHNRAINLTSGAKLTSQQIIEVKGILDYQNQQAMINDVKLNMIDYDDWINKIFCVNLFTVIDKKIIIEQINKRNISLIQAIQIHKIDLISNQTLSLQQQILINLCFCTSLKNKLILFDDCLSFLSLKNKTWIKHTILPLIMKNNFVLINRF